MVLKTATEIKVGIFVFMALLALAYMSIQVGDTRFLGDDMYRLYVHFDNVTGLKTDAPVEIAGIEVGTVDGISLHKGRAKVKLAIDPEVDIYEDSVAAIRTRGILGDKYIEVSSGTESYPKLADGDTIPRTIQQADLDQLIKKVGQIADDIGTVAKSVSNVLGGEQGEQNLREMVTSLRDVAVGLNRMVQTNMEAVNEVVENLRAFSSDLQEISGSNKQEISKIVTNFEQISRQLASVLEKIDQEEGALGTLIGDEEVSKDLKETVASLENVSRKIDEGQGTLGRLINDDTTAEELDKALEGINKFLGQQERFKTSVDFTSEYMAESGDIKSYLSLKLQPNEDKYYKVSLISDPRGRTKETNIERRYRTNNGPWNTYEEEEEETVEGGLKFSVQIAKRWHDLVLRGGILESTGGFGLDYYLWDDRIQFFFEAFDFDDEDPPHLKTGGKLFFLKNFYASLGYDDFISDVDDNRSFFAGLGLYFTDEDLKYILSNAPIPAN